MQRQISKKTWKLAIGTALVLQSVSTVGVSNAFAQSRKQPNIIVIVADDWGFTDVGAYGGEIATPNLDALAASGVRFANFHTAGSCSPTRAMLQTGVNSHRAGVGNLLETTPPQHLGKPGYGGELNGRVVTIAEVLRRAGYRTYFTGKWHLGHMRRSLPGARGYDRAMALSQTGADNFENKPNLLLYDRADWTEDGKPARLPKRFYSSKLIIDKAMSYIDSGRTTGKPFFASINFLANHIPVQAEDADIEAYRGRYAAGWTVLREERRRGAIARGVMPDEIMMTTMATTPSWSSLPPAERDQRAGAMAVYGAMATAMDREIGRLIAHLKATGEYDNTVFVFLSDNGPEPSDPMAMGALSRFNVKMRYDQRLEQQGRPGSLTVIGAGFASASAAPLRGYKFTASEGGLRVPMIFAWPGNAAIQRGAVARGFAHVTDIAPTLLAMAGAAVPGSQFEGRPVEPMEGKNLALTLAGQTATAHSEDSPVGYELAGNAALFKGSYKLVKNLPPYGDGAWHLYDIVRDPGETRDLAAVESRRVTSMQADYAAYARAEGVLPMPAGYSAPAQIAANVRRTVLIPRLLRLWPVAVAIVTLIAGFFWWRRHRRRLVSM